MPTFLPVVEALWIFLMVCVTAYAAAYHGLMAWPAPSSVVAQAMALSVSAVVALYYNGLYDVRVAGALAQAWRRFFRAALVTTASLSYIGMGAQPPSPEWGAMLNQARQYFLNAWWLTFFPGLAIFVTVLIFNFFGDLVRAALPN